MNGMKVPRSPKAPAHSMRSKRFPVLALSARASSFDVKGPTSLSDTNPECALASSRCSLIYTTASPHGGSGRMELNKLGIGALAFSVFSGLTAHASAPPSIEDFASRPRVEEVSISPDGRYLALIQTQDGKGIAVVSD